MGNKRTATSYHILNTEEDNPMPSLPTPAPGVPEHPPVGQLIGNTIDRIEPTLRSITIICGALSTFLAPIAYDTSGGKVFFAISLIPLILSALLGLYFWLKWLHDQSRIKFAEFSRTHVFIMALFDLLLALFHAAMVVGIYVTLDLMRGRKSGFIWGTWVSVLVLIDFFIHAVLFFNALPKLAKKKPKPSPSNVDCPRCGFRLHGIDDAGVAEAIAEIVRNLDKRTRQGDLSLLGRYVDDDSDFGGEDHNGRPSQDTL